MQKIENNKLSINEYQQEALRTARLDKFNRIEQITNGVLGMNGEAGECADLVKKHLFQGHDLDEMHLLKELGDVAWYLAVTAWTLGYDLETVLQMNVEKLRERYPNGFSEERSTHRETGDI
jgi:mazG nucleotide pyrophosphohydrolase domain|nr:MAG TPA: NTP-PPase-like protein [Caudoviricetes sp.]